MIGALTEQAAESITREWLARTLARVSINEPERLPDHRLVAAAPGIVTATIAAIADDAPLDAFAPGAALHGVIEEISARRAEAGHAIGDLVVELSELATATAEGLAGDDAAPLEPAVLERLASAFGALQAAAAEGYLRQRSEQLEVLANTDPLTGLYNVRLMRAELSRMSRIHKRYKHPFSVLVMDLNGLKEINDTLGHAAGDEALRAVAAVLRATIREADAPVRIGGDEFCVLLAETGLAGALEMAERVAGAAGECRLPSGAAVGLSIGVVAAPDHGDDPDCLLELADGAMYRAKKRGSGVATPPRSTL